MRKKTLLFIFGTRPEAIKMAPLVLEAKREPFFEVKVCVTAQHREMLDAALATFGITPDVDLNIMKNNQDLYDISAAIITQVRSVLDRFLPDIVLVHGDTATTLCASLAAFYHKTPIAHIEAGLRTGNLSSPWPEEANRQLVSRLAALHFAPTAQNKQNLLNEGITEENVYITGNTVIDALYHVKGRIDNDEEAMRLCQEKVAECGYRIGERKVILVTGHRRENFGDGLLQICSALKAIAQHYAEADIVYPVHLNPNVQHPVHQMLGGVGNVYLLKPLDYEPFVLLLSHAYIVLTDSGGIQEEAPGFGKPVLVMRNTTERREAVEAGTVKLVGTDAETITCETEKLLDDPHYYNGMAKAHNPYGDGHACKRIVEVLKKVL